METSKGFVTVATGDIRYYQLAYNLCLSYKTRGNGKYPFALICEKNTEYNSIFDDVVEVDNGLVTHSTLDKLLMKFSPYDETIFLDADILILKSIDEIWDLFLGYDDVSAFGCLLPLESKKGWFSYEGSGKYKEKVKYLLSMNGGIYYLKKGEIADNVFGTAEDVIKNYNSIDFKYFSKPADEPVMAMAMAVNQCHPRDIAYEQIILPAHKSKVSVDVSGNVYENRAPSRMKLIHFSSPRTKLFLYNYLCEINKGQKYSRLNYMKVKVHTLKEDCFFNLKHGIGSVMRRFGLEKQISTLKKLIR